MKNKTIVTAALLAFVAVSVITIIAKENKSGTSQALPQSAVVADEQFQGQTPEVAAEVEPGGRTVVYYFHGNMRCRICKKIEALTRQAIADGFADELAGGLMEIRAVNVDEPAQAHFVQDYQLAVRSVVVSRVEGGREVAWRRLDKVWQLVGDENAFVGYIQGETSAIMEHGADG